MTVKWIGDAAAELGLSPLDAVEILASRQEYPMNGLLDEDRFKTLKLMRAGKRSETSGSHPMSAPPGLAPGAPAHASAASPATAPVHLPAPTPPHAPEPPASAAPPPPPQPAHVVPAPPPVRPPVGERTSVTAPLQTMPGSEGEKTVILAPIEPPKR